MTICGYAEGYLFVAYLTVMTKLQDVFGPR